MRRRYAEPLLLLLAAGLVGGLSIENFQVRDWLIYDRGAVLQGEIWRIWTGHLVHFSPSHLMTNLTGAGIAMVILARFRLKLWLFCGLIAAVVSLSLLFGQSDMVRFGGLSGVVMGLWGMLAVELLRKVERVERLAGALVLFLLAAKVAMEWGGVHYLAGTGVVVAPLSHLAGGAAGTLSAITHQLLRLSGLRRACSVPLQGASPQGRLSGRA